MSDSSTIHIHRWNRMVSPCTDCGKEWTEWVEECQQISDSYATDGWEATSARITKVPKLPARNTGAATSGKPDGLSSTGVPVQIPDAAPQPPDRWLDALCNSRLLAEDAAELVRRINDGAKRDHDARTMICALAQAKALTSIALSMAFREASQ